MNIPADIWHQVFDRANGYCEYCGENLLISRAAYASAQVDHVLARAKEGEDKIENLRLACSLCNSSLARHNYLTTFEERKKHIESRLEIHKKNFSEKSLRLREPVTKG
jgi:5-methylcytosine-specific restriction endonuclease McrA